MNVEPSKASVYEPDLWFVVFWKKSTAEWINRWVPGRFKHVMAIGWVDSLKVWVSYEITLAKTAIVIRPDDDETRELILSVRKMGKTLKVTPKEGRVGFSVFGWCVPATARLVGSGSRALLCDRLWSDLIAEGAMEMDDV